MKFEITRRELILRIFRADTLPKCLYDEYNKYIIMPSYSSPYYGDLNELYYDKENNEYLNLSDMALLYDTLKIDDMILSDEEKVYLSNIIKPFRSEVQYITKRSFRNDGYEYINICVCELPDKNDVYITLPNFTFNKMYKNMIPDKEYTPDELGL